MRTDPISVCLSTPNFETTAGVVITDKLQQYREITNSTNGRWLSYDVGYTIYEAMSILKDKLDCVNLFIDVAGWYYEQQFLTEVYDYLEQNNGLRYLYIMNNTVADNIFGDVAAELPMCNPMDAFDKMPDTDDLADIADGLDELSISVDKQGYIVCDGVCMGHISAIEKVKYGRPSKEDKGLGLFIAKDDFYVPMCDTFTKGSISVKGSREDTSSIFNNLSIIEPSTIGIRHYDTKDGLDFFVFSAGDSLCVCHNKEGKTYAKPASTVRGSETIDYMLEPYEIRTAIGLLFARCAARDRRYTFNIKAELWCNGSFIPITWDDRSNSLTVGSLVINSSNYYTFVEGSI